MPPAQPRSAKHAAWLPLLVVLAGLASYSVMDGLMKAASIALGAYAAMFWRSALGAVLMAPPWLLRGRRLPSRAGLRLHAARGLVSSGMATLFFYGLVRTPMAEGMALSFIAPLLALYLAALTLGEKLSERAVAGSVLALAGVGVIAQGKFAGHYDAESLKGLAAILVSALLYAVNLVLQRRQAQLAPPQEIALFQALFVTAFLALGAPWLAPFPPIGVVPLLAASALLAGVSLMGLGWAYARAEAQVLVPLEYTAFIWAALVGWVVFGEAVTWRTLAGVALIVAGCLYAARRARADAGPGQDCAIQPSLRGKVRSRRPPDAANFDLPAP
ncbi:MAG: DMT family transporter [Sphingomonadales bacterium]|nr:DMT family transporter [Sphingomonadales bacterium]MDE2569848.1 DMT family transporter [Sphingomonadales bacterium]